MKKKTNKGANDLLKCGQSGSRGGSRKAKIIIKNGNFQPQKIGQKTGIHNQKKGSIQEMKYQMLYEQLKEKENDKNEYFESLKKEVILRRKENFDRFYFDLINEKDNYQKQPLYSFNLKGVGVVDSHVDISLKRLISINKIKSKNEKQSISRDLNLDFTSLITNIHGYLNQESVDTNKKSFKDDLQALECIKYLNNFLTKSKNEK